MAVPDPAIAAMVRVRAAGRSDLPAVLVMLTACGLRGGGLDGAWRVWVAEAGGRVRGAVALERYEAADAPGGGVFLLRSLAVAPQMRGAGLGRRLVEAALAETDALAADEKPAVVGLLTETADGYFEVPLVMALPAPTGSTRFRRDRAVLRSAGFWVAAAAIMFAIVGTGTLDGVLPLHFADRWDQTQIGIAYAVTALLIAVSSAAAGHTRPGAALAVGGIGIVAGVWLAGVSDTVPAWLAALAMIGTGVGATQTGATGILLHSVPITQIVTAMVVWSQLGIVGYLAAPALGGQLVEHLGYAWIGVLPVVAALVVAVTALHACRASSLP